MRSRIPITEDEFARLTEPTLRLFLSVDLENSTRLKQSGDGVISSWVQEVLVLINDFPQLFEASLQQCARRRKRPMPSLPPVWKILGDELIFVATIQSSPDLSDWVEAFQGALCTWNDEVRRGEPERGPLLVKGAAWLVGFPVMNTMFRTGDGREDYAGPSVDAGFRIGKLATPRRLAISVDLAWLLIRCEFRNTIRFDGPVFLKGVAEETGYPSLWIEVGKSEYVRKEAQLLGRGDQEKFHEIEMLCLHFMEEFGIPRHPPFLNADPELTPKPKGYEEQLRAAKEYLRNNVYLVEGTVEGASTPASAEVQDEILKRFLE